jgi:hypothetical protein
MFKHGNVRAARFDSDIQRGHRNKNAIDRNESGAQLCDARSIGRSVSGFAKVGQDRQQDEDQKWRQQIAADDDNRQRPLDLGADAGRQRGG